MTSEDTRLTVRVKPRAARDEVRVEGDGIEVRVTAPPIDGAANRACVRLLARRLGVPANAVCLLRGTRGPVKQVSVRGLALAEAVARLGARDGS